MERNPNDPNDRDTVFSSPGVVTSSGISSKNDEAT